MYSKAIDEYKEAINMDSRNKYSVLLGIADCHKLNGDYQLALNNYNLVATNQPNLLKDIYLKRVMCLLELKHPDKALSEIDLVVQ